MEVECFWSHVFFQVCKWTFRAFLDMSLCKKCQRNIWKVKIVLLQDVSDYWGPHQFNFPVLMENHGVNLIFQFLPVVCENFPWNSEWLAKVLTLISMSMKAEARSWMRSTTSLWAALWPIIRLSWSRFDRVSRLICNLCWVYVFIVRIRIEIWNK